ncbi:MAG: site-2 protease family protein [Pirellulaceae bacterium]
MKDTPERYSAEGFLEAARSAASEPVRVESKRSPKRMHRIAFWLAIATVLSTFWAGVGAWVPTAPIALAMEQQSLMPIRQVLLANWWGGLQFSLALMAILVAHEFGHYLLTIVYRVPSTPPLFIPFPFYSPIGTMGAVIMMQSGSADRKQIFDIGLAGPLAGLVVAIPVILFGLVNNQPITYATTDAVMQLGQPLLIQWLASVVVPTQAADYVLVANTESSPLLMAGWVGLLVTGLNMMPLGQLDGGHVTFGLVGQKSYYIAVGALIASIAFMITTGIFLFAIMLFLVMLMGLRHPPSSDDHRTLGLARQIVGWCSLILPVLCVPANPIVMG